eukprot:TRINITY_DN709_c3_g1_i1.p1 TRINITY_DN709_c3_g1~~TRINITY_DN709_c3_g1_i1.p1  ORF type:complete len:259 (+),score=46.91 TRINITY_DN709_c3_g1_i1:73-849(+)
MCNGTVKKAMPQTTPRREIPVTPGRKDRDTSVRAAGMMVLAPTSTQRGSMWQPPGAVPASSTENSSGRIPAGLKDQISKSTAAPSALSRYPPVRRNTGPSPVPDDADDDEDFRSLRQEAKTGPRLPPKPKVCATALKHSTAGPFFEGKLADHAVDPCYFDYRAAYERRREEASRSSQATPREEKRPSRSAEAEMVEFLKMQGLTGPVQAYARAFALQGVEDPTTLVSCDDVRLGLLITRSEMECADELVLRDGLRAFQ